MSIRAGYGSPPGPAWPGVGRAGPALCHAVGGSGRPDRDSGLAGDQVVGEQQDGCAGDGGEPGGGVEESVQGVDVEDLGGGPAAAEGAGDADEAGEDEALLSFAGDQHVGEQACAESEDDPGDDAHGGLLRE